MLLWECSVASSPPVFLSPLLALWVGDCVCMYVCMYVCTHTPHMHVQETVCMYVCTHTAYARTYAHITSIHINLRLEEWVQVICLYAYIHSYIHTHTINMCIPEIRGMDASDMSLCLHTFIHTHTPQPRIYLRFEERVQVIRLMCRNPMRCAYIHTFIHAYTHITTTHIPETLVICLFLHTFIHTHTSQPCIYTHRYVPEIRRMDASDTPHVP
jgi:hypothetical protein